MSFAVFVAAHIKLELRDRMPKKTLRYDFWKAAMRHYNDGCFLYDSSKIYSAGHLFGFVAECGIKALLVCSGDVEDNDKGDDSNVPKVHINKLCAYVAQGRLTSRGRCVSKYYALIPNISNFEDWNVNHRYKPSGLIPKSVDKWKIAAKEVMNMLESARLDGVIQ